MTTNQLKLEDTKGWLALSWISLFLFPFMGIFAVIKMLGAKKQIALHKDSAQKEFRIAKRLTQGTFLICLVHFIVFVIVFLHYLPD